MADISILKKDVQEQGTQSMLSICPNLSRCCPLAFFDPLANLPPPCLVCNIVPLERGVKG